MRHPLVTLALLGAIACALGAESARAQAEDEPQPGPVTPNVADDAVPQVDEADEDAVTDTSDDDDVYVDEDATAQAPDVLNLRYVLESVEVVGNTRTRASVIRSYVPLEPGESFDPETHELETVQFALMGTGWFHEVHVRLRRGAQRGWVVVVVEVVERNTVVVEQVALGLAEGLSSGTNARVFPYVGLTVTETNLLGRGVRLSVSGLLSRHHQGGRIDFNYPRFLGGNYGLRFAPFLNNSRQYFGLNPTVTSRCVEPAPRDCVPETLARNAVVFYRRAGFYLGTRRAIGGSLGVDLGTQLEWINVTSRPEAASELRGAEVRPIDFSILPGRSFVSVLRLGLTYDRRDDPGLPTRGSLLRIQADAGTRLLGSAYEFVRLQAQFRQWVPLASHHTLRFALFGGLVLGDAPFFYKFHASDMTDLIPARILEMELDRRAPPNLLATSVLFMRNEEVALRADVEYNVSLLRHGRRGGLRGAHAYVNLGTYLLADVQDLEFAVPGFDGAARIPIDLTFDLGIRLDTSIGVFQFGFSNLLGFIP